MTKKIKLGLSAIVAFAMMFATSASAVAQEQANAPTDKVEVKESAEKMTSTNLKPKLNSVWVFTGDDEDDILNFNEYSQTEPQPSNCGSGSTLPCTVTFPPEVDSPSALKTYLETPGRSEGEILAMSNELRD